MTKKQFTLRSSILIVASLIASYILSPLAIYNPYELITKITKGESSYCNDVLSHWLNSITLQDHSVVRFYIMELFFFAFVFCGFTFVLGFTRYKELVFKYRWLIGCMILAILVFNRMNGDSFALYHYWGEIQKNHTTDLLRPIWADVRAIRSDEYLVTDVSILHSLVTGSYFSRGIIGYILDPFLIIEFLLYKVGIDYAYSFIWYLYIIPAFLISFEFFRIITSDDRGVSFVATLLVYCSSFFLWWGFPTQLMTSQGIVIGLYYFIRSEKKLLRVIWLYILGIFTFKFTTNLYPAWQIPLAYIILALAIWTIYSNWSYIKRFGKFEYCLIGVAVIGGLAGGLLYIYSSLDYIHAMMNSVYPGLRRDFGGDYIALLGKPFMYIEGVLFGYKDFAMPNACEVGTIISLFPLPTLLIWWQTIKRKKDILLIGLLSAVLILLFSYCCFGLPEFLGKITLLCISTTSRTIDIICYLQVIFLASYLSRVKELPHEWFSFDKNKVSVIIYSLVAILSSVLVLWWGLGRYEGYLGNKDKIVLGVIFAIVFASLFLFHTSKGRKALLWSLAFVSIITGIYVRPISVGLDPLYKKPAASAIQEIAANDNGKWIAIGGDYYSSYTYLNGADTINYINTEPHIELWELVDENHTYIDIYNRFAHVSVQFTEEPTSFELNTGDSITVHLNYDDISKLDVKYLASWKEEVSLSDSVAFKEIYQEDGFYIYEIVSK